MEQRILFRCDGGRIPEIGTGHVRRCLLLADYHWRHYRSVARFLMRQASDGVNLVLESGLPVEVQTFATDGDEDRAFTEALDQFHPDVCVFDCLNVAEELLALCHSRGTVTVSLDDVGAGLTRADIVVNAIVEHPGTCYSGPEYLILPETPPASPPQRGGHGQGVSLFISAGGYDHRRLAERLLQVLKGISEVKRIHLIASDAEVSQRCQGLVAEDTTHPAITIQHAVPNIGTIMAQCDLAVVSGGLTLFEAMRLGVPSVVVAQYAHQATTAAVYASRESVVSVGLPDHTFETKVRRAAEQLIQAPEIRYRLGRNAQRLVDGRGLKRVAELMRICEFLEWDTTFFGRRIAVLKPLRLTERILNYALERCRQWGVECLYYQCDCHHAPSVRLAEQHGFHFVDMRLTFEYDLTRPVVPFNGLPHGIEMRPCRPDDVPALKAIASDSYLDSRYYFDQRFARERCTAFYTEWIEKCANGFVDHVLVAEHQGQAVGYVTCRCATPYLGHIDLIGVHPSMRNRRIGRALVDAALRWFLERDFERVEVATQGRNYAAQRLYQRCGFVSRQTRLWYHKWLT
ncbi:MAG: GNAT family N-acetyltransferase [Candidatus Omnitrophica bacterium]|nr:GNAT family N-acetyltransferase [Candidatus Omnitrophota bacterium]